MLDELAKIDINSLPTDADKHNYRLFKDQHETFLAGIVFKTYLMPCQLLEGPHNELLQLKDAVVFEKKKHYSDYISRLGAVSEWFDQLIATMQEGIDSKLVLPQRTLEGVAENLSSQISADPEKSSYYKPFLEMNSRISEVEAADLRQQMKDVILKVVNPSFEKFLSFFKNVYLASSPDVTSCKSLPNGDKMYIQCLKFHTSTDLTPEDIHNIGLKEVERIRAEIEAIMKEVGFSGTVKEFIVNLRADARFRFSSEDEIVAAYRAQCKEIDPELPKLFKKLPRTPYGVCATPSEYASGAPAAYYVPPSADGKKPGWIHVNCHKLETRYSYEMQPLCLHESVPGHHLQVAYVMEMENVPLFRTSMEDRKYFEAPGRYPLNSAYIEGWGLYSEGLGKDLGLYKDPYSRMGRLTYDMLRSCRLVADTGLHWMNWSYDQTIEFMMQNTAMGSHGIHQEVKRYIAWPGQACGYKIGELELRKMRARAETELGDKFDVRDFHEVIFECGPAPLRILDTLIDEYIAKRLKH